MNDVLTGKQKVQNVTRGRRPAVIVAAALIAAVLCAAVFSLGGSYALAHQAKPTCQYCHNEKTHRPEDLSTYDKYRHFHQNHS